MENEGAFPERDAGAPPIAARPVDLPDAAERLEAAEQRLGLAFRDRRLLLQALLHRSYVLERERDGLAPPGLASNERLEFLGDAVLSMLVARFAFFRYPADDEGRLTEIRSALVRRSTLALLADELGLGDVLYMGRIEQRRGARGRATVLAEAFEAVLAAIYLDQGIDRADAFLTGLLDGRVDHLLERAGGLNAKSRLQELAQARLRLLPRYALLERRGPPHDSRFDVQAAVGGYQATGTGTSIRAAEQAAATALLDLLRTALDAEPVEHAQGEEGRG